MKLICKDCQRVRVFSKKNFAKLVEKCDGDESKAKENYVCRICKAKLREKL